jgi:septal ring factor EnvC (AmiA/AmiB activator)
MRRQAAIVALLCAGLPSMPARAQDVPGIEVCTRESRLDRRTSCLQSNIEYLQQVIGKNSLDAQQKLAAANREVAALQEQLAVAKTDIAALKETVAVLRTRLEALAKAPAPAGKADNKPQGK